MPGVITSAISNSPSHNLNIIQKLGLDSKGKHWKPVRYYYGQVTTSHFKGWTVLNSQHFQTRLISHKAKNASTCQWYYTVCNFHFCVCNVRCIIIHSLRPLWLHYTKKSDLHWKGWWKFHWNSTTARTWTNHPLCLCMLFFFLRCIPLDQTFKEIYSTALKDLCMI